MKIYIFIITLLFISCQEEITLDLPKSQDKIVVEGSIENGFPPIVLLTKNQGYFDEFDIDKFYIDDVDSIKIWYIDDVGTIVNRDLELFTDFASPITGDPIPLYTVADLDTSNFNNYEFSQSGRTYYLEIKWNNQIVSSSTTIPEVTPLDCLWVEKSENRKEEYMYDIRGLYSDPADQDNYIIVKSKRIQHYEYEDSLKCLVKNIPDGSLNIIDAGSDILINGESFETYFPRPNDNGFPSGSYNTNYTEVCNNDTLLFKNDVVIIKYCQIDEPSLKFWRGLRRQTGTNGNPFAEPLNLVSNINNGLGIFTGYGSVYYKIPIIDGTIIKTKYKAKILDIF